MPQGCHLMKIKTRQGNLTVDACLTLVNRKQVPNSGVAMNRSFKGGGGGRGLELECREILGEAMLTIKLFKNKTSVFTF